MYVTPPWKPTAIELTTAHRAYWWQIGDADERPERWTVHMGIHDTGGAACPPEVRHVGIIELSVAELADVELLTAAAGSWARAFLAEAVAEPGSGALIEELDRRIAPGPARVVLLRRMYLSDAWRGCGLAPPLLNAALCRFAPMARLAACRVGRLDLAELVPGLTRVEAESAARHAARMLTRAGFFTWRGVHLTGLCDPAERPTDPVSVSRDVSMPGSRGSWACRGPLDG